MWTDKRQISTDPVLENVLTSSLQGQAEGQLPCQKAVNPNLLPLCLAPKWSPLSAGMCHSFDSLHRSQTGCVPALAPLLCPVANSCVPYLYFGLTQGSAKSSTVRIADRFLQSSVEVESVSPKSLPFPSPPLFPPTNPWKNTVVRPCYRQITSATLWLRPSRSNSLAIGFATTPLSG